MARAALLRWRTRTLNALSTYLPVLLMALLALGTWWLVKNTPTGSDPGALTAVKHEPDYSMSLFQLQRFGPEGALRVQIEGAQLHHYPDTDTLEIDRPVIRAVGAKGQVSVATANKAVALGNGHEVELQGGARVQQVADASQEAIEFGSEWLRVDLKTERVVSPVAVRVKQGATELRADTMAYDHQTGVVDFSGRVRALFSLPRKN
jgi:lipopolysaccharide export system protein LptC